MTEFDMAYHHNVALKRKKRLIVLMMLDRPTDFYANDAPDTATLRQYLRQYTYIDYTADDWFDKLLYALPFAVYSSSSRIAMTTLTNCSKKSSCSDYFRGIGKSPKIILIY